MAAAAVAIVLGLARLRTAWPPPHWPYPAALPFVTPTLAGSALAWTVVAVALFVWGTALLIYVRALTLERAYVPVRTIVVVQLLLSAILLAAPLPINADQYAYVGYAELVRSGENPYAPPLRSAPMTPQLATISPLWAIDEGAADAKARVIVRSRYGAVWLLGSTAVLAPFAAASPEAKAWILRVLAALLALACTAVLWLAVRDRPWAGGALAAFALNPAVALQTALGAHNDVAALFFALCAYVLAARGRVVASGVALALSIGVKLTFAPFLPALIVFAFVRRGARRGIATTAAIAAVVLAAAVPFGLQRTLLQPIGDIRLFNSPYLATVAAILARRLPGMHGVDLARSFGWSVTAAIVACGLALAIAAARRRRSPVLEAVMLIVIFCDARFEPWYALVLTPLLLIPARWSLPLFVGISLASQVLMRKEFIGGYDALPLRDFLVLAVLAVVAARVALAPRPAVIR